MRNFEEFSLQVLDTRLARGWGTRDLAKHSSVDMATISRIENLKTKPTLRTVVKLCDGFGLPLDDFVPVDGLRTRGDVPDSTIASFRGLHHFKAGSAVYQVEHWITRVSEFMGDPIQSPGPFVSLLLAPSPFHNIAIEYPPDHLTPAILDNWHHGGLVQYRDVQLLLNQFSEGSDEYDGLSRSSKDAMRRLAAQHYLRLAAIHVEGLGNQLGIDVLGLAWSSLSTRPVERPVPPRLMSAFVALWYWIKAADPEGSLLTEFTQTIEGFSAQ